MSVPTPSLHPVFRHALVIRSFGGREQFPAMLDHFYKECDSSTIQLEPLPGLKVIYSKDPTLVNKILVREGKYPKRAGYLSDTFQKVQHEHRMPNDVFSSEGEDWKSHRRRMNGPLLVPRTVRDYTPKINEVTNEYVNKLQLISSENFSFIRQIKLVNSCYSLEVMVRLIFGVPLGMLKFGAENNRKFQDYISSFSELFETFTPLSYFPYTFVRYFYRNLWKRVNGLYGRSLLHSRELIKSFESNPSSDCIWNELQSLDDKTRLGNVTAVMSGGIDTTATQLVFIYQLLALNPEVQDRVHQQIQEVCGNRLDKQITADDIDKLTLVRGVVKEGQRLFPLIPFLPRQLPENFKEDSVPFTIPKNVIFFGDNYNIGREEKYFMEAEKFKPERYVRMDDNFEKVPQSLVFGAGQRMCIGRRIAELEMKMAVAKVIQSFVLRVSDCARPVFKGTLIPDRDPVFRFLPR